MFFRGIYVVLVVIVVFYNIIRVNPCKFVVKNPTYLHRLVGRVDKHYY